jgi:ATP-dependent Lon protease
VGVSENSQDALPLLPLRDLVVFPHMVVPLIVGRPASRAALRAAQASNQRIFVVAQKAAGTSDPGPEDVHEVGCVAHVIQLLELPDDNIKVLVEGEKRGRIDAWVDAGDHRQVRVLDLEMEAVEPVPSTPDAETGSDDGVSSGEGEDAAPPEDPAAVMDALVRTVRGAFEQYVKLNKGIPPEMLLSVASMDDPGRLSDTLVAHLDVKIEDRQALLEMPDPAKRLARLLDFIQGEIEIRGVERKIKSRVRKQMERSQKEFYLNEQMQAIQKELGEKDEFKAEMADLERRIGEKPLSLEARERVHRELRKLKMMSPMSAEAAVIRNYVDQVLALPWEEYADERLDLDEAATMLDEDHHGLDKVKERILEHLAVSRLVERQQGPVLCLVGPPGVGKTSLARSLARATGRSFVRQALGGVRDEAEIRGHRRTYIGALPGKIIQCMRKAETSNPVFLLDEVDKMSSDFRGDPSAALLEVLDPEQNGSFNDHYLDLDYDLSRVMFVCTANDLSAIPVPLLDRLEIIKLPGYTEEEKLAIARRYLIPKQLEANGLVEDNVMITRQAGQRIVREYTREAGVRGLEREIARVFRKVARRVVTKGPDTHVRVTSRNVSRLLGVPPFTDPRVEDEDAVGVVQGLAVSAVGGLVLDIEVAVVPGSGRLILTGRLGDTLRESAQAGLSYIRSRADQLGLERGFHTKVDVHIHYPGHSANADGPSAGIAMVAAMTSALTDIAVRRDVAVTGEVSLRGRVLPVGGIKEKVLAAHRRGLTTVLLPALNEKDLDDVPQAVRAALDIQLMGHMDDVLRVALAWPNERVGFAGSARSTMGFRSRVGAAGAVGAENPTDRLDASGGTS